MFFVKTMYFDGNGKPLLVLSCVGIVVVVVLPVASDPKEDTAVIVESVTTKYDACGITVHLSICSKGSRLCAFHFCPRVLFYFGIPFGFSTRQNKTNILKNDQPWCESQGMVCRPVTRSVLRVITTHRSATFRQPWVW